MECRPVFPILAGGRGKCAGFLQEDLARLNWLSAPGMILDELWFKYTLWEHGCVFQGFMLEKPHIGPNQRLTLAKVVGEARINGRF